MATVLKTPATPLREPAELQLIERLVQSPAVANAQRWLTRERAWINEQHLQLCRIPAPTFFEQKRAEWFRCQLASFGWNAGVDRAGNVVATFGARDNQRAVVLSAHLDTVFAPERPEQIYYAPDGRLVGPGTSDNGSGLAAILAIARMIAETTELHQLGSSLRLVANVGEEGEGNLSGMRYLCQHAREVANVEAFIVIDGPSVDHVTAQALASRRYEVILSGPGGHSWNDHGIPNPVHVLGDVISYFVRSAEEHGCGDRKSTCSFNFSVIEGGTSINSIPSCARAKLDVRSEDAAVLEDFSNLLSATVERALEHANLGLKNGRVTGKIKELGSRPGGKLAPDAPLLQLVRAVDSHLNVRSRVDCASTDANVPLAMKLPAVSIGAGGRGGGAHTTSEWYQPEGRELGLKRILLILAALYESGLAGAVTRSPQA
ncbi:MAG: M20/M25/M40 family metallo-hydrolase [Acidobacteriaceae bacterium]|nr:M20/M25/M40 family metallo-hydrolase [Acidobacteriaceae bacterium]